jgi:hypothetical protein
MSWYKIHLTQDQISSHNVLDIIFEFVSAKSKAGHPPNFTLFQSTEVDGVTSHIFFLPPESILYCPEILKRYNAVPSDAPDFSTVERVEQ